MGNKVGINIRNMGSYGTPLHRVHRQLQKQGPVICGLLATAGNVDFKGLALGAP